MVTGLSGLASGIDTSSLVNAIMTAQRLPITRMKAAQSAIDVKVSKLGDFVSKLGDLKSAMETLSSTGDALAFSGTTGDEAIATTKATGDAAPGSYELVVSELATAEKDRSVAFAAGPGAEVKAGEITIATPGEDPVTVTIEDGDTLSDVMGKINASGARVDASVIEGSSGAYLQIVAQDTGHEVGGSASDAVTITESYTGTTGAELGMTELATATNAQLTVDGIAVEQRTNTITGVLEGVTFELAGKGTTTVGVATDKEGTRENVQAFVDAFNAVADLLKTELDVDADSNFARSLTGEFGIRQLQSDLRTATSTSIAGLDGAFDSLASIGITTGSGGKLELDATAFDAAMDGDLGAVGELFTAAGGVAERLTGVVDKFAGDDGLLVSRKDAFEATRDRYDDRIDTLETRLEKVQSNLEERFVQMELAMARIQQQTNALTSMLLSDNSNG